MSKEDSFKRVVGMLAAWVADVKRDKTRWKSNFNNTDRQNADTIVGFIHEHLSKRGRNGKSEKY